MTDFERLKNELHSGGYLRLYLEANGVEILSGGQLRCFNTGAHARGDKNASAHLYSDDIPARVKCFGCGKSWDIFSACQHFEGVDFMGAAKSLAARFGLKFPDKSQERSAGKAGRAPVAFQEAKAYLEKCRSRLSETDYFLRRGISAATAEALGCGFDPEYYFKSKRRKIGAVIFPSSGGWAARSVEGKCHDFPSGAKGLAFNLDALWATDATKAVFIVEGQFDALSIAEVGGSALALGGAQNYGAIVEACKSKRPSAALIVALDNESDERKKATIEAARRKLVSGLRAAGAFCYEPESAELFGAHDANDALLKNREAFSSEVERLSWLASEAFVLNESESAESGASSGFDSYLYCANEIAAPVPEANNPRAVFAGNFLRRGQTLTIVSCPGVGKSVISNQCAVAWAAGETDIVGLRPVGGRRFRVLVVQFEDDEDEVSEFFENLKIGYTRDISCGGYGWSLEKFVDAKSRICFLNVRKYAIDKRAQVVDDTLVSVLKQIQREKHFDIVIINPLTAAISEVDLSSNRESNEFFRQKLQPVLDDPATNCALVLIHHTSKTPKDAKSLEQFFTGAAGQYAAQGAAALMNWSRAMLFIAPTASATDFKLVGAKRGKRLGWKDSAGNPVVEKHISYSEDILFWRETPASALEKLCSKSTGASKEAIDPKLDASIIANELRGLPKAVSQTELWEMIKKRFTGLSRQTAVRDLIQENPASWNVVSYSARNENKRIVKYYGGPAQLVGFNGEDD